MELTAIELCAGGGGQALGLEMAGFHHLAAVEYEAKFCETLRHNRPLWNVVNQDVRNFSGKDYEGVDLLAAGVPCPPFSVAGKQLGADDERDMFPAALRIIKEAQPRAVMLENVPGLASQKFKPYRENLLRQLRKMGYEAEGMVLQAADFGVPQLRPRFILVALRPDDFLHFHWPAPVGRKYTVGETLLPLMAENGWKGAGKWAKRANGIAPTVVGGSKKHGGPDLGPTRAKAQWRALHVDGMGLANAAPDEDAPLDYMPRLTVPMVAKIQSFPEDWTFVGGKTNAYRQVGNAFPPQVARFVGAAIRNALFREQRRADLADCVSASLQFRLLEEATHPKAAPAKAISRSRRRLLGS